MLSLHRSLRNSTSASIDATGLIRQQSWLTPLGQRRRLRCPKPAALSNSARSGPMQTCASRRLQRGRRVPPESAVASKLSEWIVPLEQPSTAAAGGRSERVSEPDRASFRSRRQLRSAQGIDWSAVEIDCGTGCLFSWLLLFGQAKRSNSPIKGETVATN